ncbi:MAG: 4a-hydroxytetrahydrobiopterin dehydratase [Emcibacter sp.]|nr:4a-hydroxytetrahydrobiopterin dehydratase [Emcibacter sp.]
MVTLSKGEIRKILTEIDGWEICENRPAIKRYLKFSDFNEAFSFMSAIALKAERMDHHPEWRNIYDKLDIILTTYEEGGVTAMDINLARFINKTYNGRNLS